MSQHSMLPSIRNHGGLVAEFSPRGASLQRFLVPDGQGGQTNLVMSPADALAPRSACAYAGAIVGPTAGRVRKGLIRWGDAQAQLDINEAPHHLHGGAHGLSDVMWELEEYQEDALTFTISLADGLGGYPGNRNFRVSYRLTDDNELQLDISANSDLPTWFNPTSHIYWNLSGDCREGLDTHTLQVNADQVYRNREDHTLASLMPVDGSIFDLRESRQMGSMLEDKTNRQVLWARGLNHLFALSSSAKGTAQLILSHPTSGRNLRVETTLPGIWLYSGGFLNSNLQLADGQIAAPNLALAIEPQIGPGVLDLEWEGVSIPITKHYMHNISFRFENLQ